MHNRPVLHALKVSDVPKEHQDIVIAISPEDGGDIDIHLITQRTGFGYRRYFLCPACGRKCGKIHWHKGQLHCRTCTPLDIYGYRQSLYDEGGTALIVWNMRKLVKAISDQPIKWPFHYYDYSIEPPPGMTAAKYNRWEKKQRDTLLKLQILENMRTCAIFLGCKFGAADIKRYTSPEFTKYFELWQVAEFQIFGRGIPPEHVGLILDDEVLERLNCGELPSHILRSLREGKRKDK